MIKAGALLYAMFLVIVITLISSSFILVNYYSNAYVIRILKQEQLFQDAHSGINYGLVMHRELPINTKIEVDLFSNNQHRVTITKNNWGALFVLVSEAVWKTKKVKKLALIGANMDDGEKIALYLANQNKPLSLTGATKIVGNCYLPEAGVKRAYIEGKSFVGNKLIDGIKYFSNKTLPPISEELIQENQRNFFNNRRENDSLMNYDVVFNQDTIFNSFENKTLVLYSPLAIELSNKIIEGNIIIQSGQKITIKSTSSISNALLYAKGIILEKNVEGNMQLFAEDSILVGENCQLHYPSVVAVIGVGTTTYTRKIIIDEKVAIKGTVFLYNKEVDRKHRTLISVGKESKITGQIYASELLELKGEVHGSVFCKNFLLKTPSSVYENHLIDATINRKELSEYFVGVPLTENIEKQRLIKWLN